MSRADTPLVSVCIPLYNSGPYYIREAIESVLAQTLTDWELIITDDGSADGSSKIAASYSDPRIRYLLNPERLGAESNWNRCVNEGRGIYRKLLCHDDRLHPDCLARQAAVFEQPGKESVSLVTAGRRIINSSGKTILTLRWKSWDQPVAGREAMRQIVRFGTNLIGEPSAVLFRASDWNVLNGFSARYPYVIDLDFWFRLLKRGDCFCLAEPLCDFRVSAQSWSYQLARRQSAQFCALVRAYRAMAPKEISSFDIVCGCVISRGLALLRRMLYRYL